MAPARAQSNSGNRGPAEAFTFRVGDVLYGVDTRWVERVMRIDEFTPVPSAPDFVAGVAYRRGAVIPLLLVHRVLGHAARDAAKRNWVVVLLQEKERIGLVVDEVHEVRPYPPQKLAGATKYLAGTFTAGGTTVAMLNTEKLLTAMRSAVATGSPSPEAG